MITLATKTLEAIDSAIEADQGSKFRELQGQAFKETKDAFDPRNDPFRTHLGASVIGRPCARELWYGWHWVKRSIHRGQLLRLFNRGHLEEPRFIAMLRLIGCQVWGVNEDGYQARIIACGGHFGGSLDGVVVGLPEAPETPVLAEFKTHGNKSFMNLKSDGVQRAKWEHYVQMVMYMEYYKLTLALYFAVNKDTDELYGEFIPADPVTAERYAQRAQSVIDSPEPPQRLPNASPSWYQCKMCSYSKMCLDFEYPEVNCRTCTHSTPVADAKWLCERKKKEAVKVCKDHIFNPTMLNGIEILIADNVKNQMTFKRKDGSVVTTGTGATASKDLK